jgi:hypothetical protein
MLVGIPFVNLGGGPWAHAVVWMSNVPHMFMCQGPGTLSGSTGGGKAFRR